jgi:predicted LPLAT superfamily acyltransferase
MKKETHWSLTQERGSLWGLNLLFLFYRYAGRYFILLLLYPIIFYFFITGTAARKASKTYLNKLYQAGLLLKKPHLGIRFQHFLAMGVSVLDKVDVWLGKIAITSITHIHYSIFERLFLQKKGALIIGSHLGNLEICRALSHRHTQACFNVLVFTEHAKKLTTFIERLHPDVCVNLIEVTMMSPDVVMVLQDKIDRGEYVVIAGDRTSTTVSGRVIYSDFLNEKAPFPQGPFILSGLLQCPVLMMFCLREKTFRKKNYHLIFEELSTGVRWTKKSRELELALLVQKYAKTLEKYCALYPLQWFNFFDFWKKESIVPSIRSSKKKSHIC